MKKIFQKIWLPIIFLGVAFIQSFGIDFNRSSNIHYGPLSLYSDSTITESSDSTEINDSLHIIDSLNIIDSIRVVDSTRIADSLRIIDSLALIPPDSLKFTDSLRYEFFPILRDSTTRLFYRDSLVTAGDTLGVIQLDSLYIQDSTEISIEKFNLWYSSLDKKEKKKYHYQIELKKKIARTDSIMKVKDSIKTRKDSIANATPRILETFVLPDSLQYKRIIMWKHDRRFNDIHLETQDTSYNYHFNDYPFLKNDVDATYLGVIGSPVQTHNFFKRKETDGVIFYTPLNTYSYSPESLEFYNTKTPYTELAYWGTLFSNAEKEEANIKILSTQNITPELNLRLEYHRFGSNGMLRNEDTDNRTAVVSTNYMGKRYLMHAGYIYHKVGRSENGGLIDPSLIRDTLVDSREIPVHLKDASSLMKKHTVFLDQSYRIPFTFITNIKNSKADKALKIQRDSLVASGDSTALAEFDSNIEMIAEAETAQIDSINTNITTAFIGHSSEFSTFKRTYQDMIAGSDEDARNFFNNRFFINPTNSYDSLRVMRLDNKVYIRLQPWAEDGIISKIDAGIGDKLHSYYNFNENSFLRPSNNTIENSAYLYAGVQGQYKKYLKWNANGDYTFLGKEINDFGIDAEVSVYAYPFRRHKESPLIFNARFETNLDEPDHYEQNLFTNHYKWDNNFSKTSTTKVEANLEIPRWDLMLGVGYSLLNNNIYYDTLGIVRQNTEPMSILSASLTKNFRIWKFHLDHQALAQFSSNENVLPVPTISLNFRYYLQFNVVKKVMQMQIGANATFTSRWYAPAYNPVLGVFHSQNEIKYGACPSIDAFVNIQWKRACIYIKFVNANMGWPNDKADYFTAHNYIRPQRAIKFGIFWPFYFQTQNKTSQKQGQR